VNITGFKTLDKLGCDKKVLLVYKDDDGIWVELNKGWHFEGCISYRVNTCKEATSDLSRVE
jgi:hypothetical protein